MIEPLLSDEAFLRDVESARRSSRALDLWWLGQSGFLVRHDGERLLFDPYLSESLTQKYAGTEKPHVRMTRRVVDPSRLRNIDVITSTHNHTDHLDAATLVPVLDNNPDAVLLVSPANREFAANRIGHDERIRSIAEGEVFNTKRFRFGVVPAAHARLERDERGHPKCVGFVVGTDAATIYHSGDGVVFDGMAEAVKPFNVDIAILPINGKVGNMNGVDAARLGKAIGAKLVIPCHFEMFEFNTASPDAFREECERIGQPYRVLRAGERLTLDAGGGLS